MVDLDIPDGVASSEADPVRHGLVLLLLNSQSALGTEALVGRLKEEIRVTCQTTV